MQHRVAVAVDPLDGSRTEMRKAKLEAGKRNDDLPAVEVPREDEVECRRRQAPRDPRKVAEQDSEARVQARALCGT